MYAVPVSTLILSPVGQHMVVIILRKMYSCHNDWRYLTFTHHQDIPIRVLEVEPLAKLNIC